MIGLRWLSEHFGVVRDRLTAAVGDRVCRLSALMTVAPLHLGAEVERSARRRRAAARLNTSVMARVQGAAAVTRRQADDNMSVDRLRRLMSEVARRAER